MKSNASPADVRESAGSVAPAFLQITERIDPAVPEERPVSPCRIDQRKIAADDDVLLAVDDVEALDLGHEERDAVGGSEGDFLNRRSSCIFVLLVMMIQR